ncbi:hypothetical protein L6452_01426 [Arctium lappa]|uniref:Uncharacterized protein n=1 Tax=Arctium lappa TaxID=4217 RepID=A0ACB9FHN7_ARCLA|nr:hypothetical protein L6452_01426 [Arctium lappa]
MTILSLLTSTIIAKSKDTRKNNTTLQVIAVWTCALPSLLEQSKTFESIYNRIQADTKIFIHRCYSIVQSKGGLCVHLCV